MPGSCNSYTLALAAGELAWIGVFFVFQAHFLKKLSCFFVDFVFIALLHPDGASVMF